MRVPKKQQTKPGLVFANRRWRERLDISVTDTSRTAFCEETTLKKRHKSLMAGKNDTFLTSGLGQNDPLLRVSLFEINK